jgi:hypothetical protein
VAPTFVKKNRLLVALKAATTFEEFRANALELDRVCGHDAWRRRFECADYDYNLVRDFLDDLYHARKQNNPKKAMFLLRSTLRRNLGGWARMCVCMSVMCGRHGQ